MKKFQMFALSLTLLFSFSSTFLSFSSQAQTTPTNSQDVSVWGRLVKLPESKTPRGEKLFIHYTKKGQHFLYPLTANTSLTKKLQKNKGEFVQVQGTFQKHQQFFEGQSVSYLSLKVQNLQVLTLDKLKVKEDRYPPQELPRITFEEEKYAPSAPRETWNVPSLPGGVAIPDDITNASLAVSGAILLGIILAPSLRGD